MQKKTVGELKHLSNNEFILYHHVGLGDSIICNGLVNYLTNIKDKIIHLPCRDIYIESLKFLYSENQNVRLFSISFESETEDVLKYSKFHDLEILKVGFEFRTKGPFNKNFYKQLQLPYSYSHKYFYIPNIEFQFEINLENSLKNIYEVKDKFNLVHQESHDVNFNISFDKSIPNIYVEKKTDLYKNIFYYKNLISKAEEIHCVNSSFFHLVERCETKAKLFFHDKRGGKMYFKKKWKIITYNK